MALLTWTPSLLGVFWSKKNHRESFIPFGIPNGVQLTCQFLMIFYGPKQAPRVKELGQKSPGLPTRVGGAPYPPGRLPISWSPRGSSDVHSMSPGSYSSKKSRCQRFHSVWTPFDIPFLRNTETGNKTTIWAGPPVNRLVPKVI